MRAIIASGAVSIGLALASPALAQSDAEKNALAKVHELREEKQNLEALALLDTLRLQFPDSRYLRQIYPWIYLHDLDSPETALEKALELKRDYPDYSQGYYWEAKSLETMHDWAGCLRALREFPDFDRRFRRHALTAACYYMTGQLAEALAALPSREDLGAQGFERYQGWHIWLEGLVAKRPVFESQKDELRAAVTSDDPRQRAVVLMKLGILGVPEAAEIASLAGEKGPEDLTTAAANLHADLIARPPFHRELPRRDIPPGSEPVPTKTALAEIWAVLDRLPGTGEIPEVEGEWLSEQIAAIAKSYPSAAQPMTIQANEARDAYSMTGTDWIPVDGQIDMSYEPGRVYSFQDLRDGKLFTVSVGLRRGGTEVTIIEYRRNGDNLVLASTVWTDSGEVFYLFTSATTFIPFER